MGQRLRTDHGQGLVEAVLGLATFFMVIGLLTYFLTLSWRQILIEQLAYDCSICILNTENPSLCSRKAMDQAQRQLILTTKKLRVDARGSGRNGICKISYAEGKRWETKSVQLDLNQIKKASRSFFLRR